MRRCNLANLLYYFHRAACRFDGGFSFFADSIHFKSEFTFQFTITENFDFIVLAQQPVHVKILGRKFGDIVLLRQLFDLAEVKHFVFHAVRVLETAFGDPALDGHLSALMRHFALETAAALVALVTFRGGAAVPGALAPSQSFFLVCRAFCRPELM